MMGFEMETSEGGEKAWPVSAARQPGSRAKLSGPGNFLSRELLGMKAYRPFLTTPLSSPCPCPVPSHSEAVPDRQGLPLLQ